MVNVIPKIQFTNAWHRVIIDINVYSVCSARLTHQLGPKNIYLFKNKTLLHRILSVAIIIIAWRDNILSMQNTMGIWRPMKRNHI